MRRVDPGGVRCAVRGLGLGAGASCPEVCRQGAAVDPDARHGADPDRHAEFFDGLPDEATVQKVYDNLDFGRGVEAFIAGIPATSVYALCEGFSQAGFKSNHGIGITESLSDARSLFLTPNSTVVYVWFCVDLKDGPMVVQTPPNVLGIIDDAYFRYVTDLGVTGPDQGKGGKYLLVPPDHTGTLPNEGYVVQKPRTYSNLFIIRAFVQDGDVAAAVQQRQGPAHGSTRCQPRPIRPSRSSSTSRACSSTPSTPMTFISMKSSTP